MSENERKKYVPGFNIYEQENISDTFYSDNNLSSDIFSEKMLFMRILLIF